MTGRPVVYERNGRRYTWDAAAEAANRRRHGVSFRLAVRVFDQDIYLVRPATAAEGRNAEVAIGPATDVMVVVVFRRRDDGAEILSARLARKEERRDYGRKAR